MFFRYSIHWALSLDLSGPPQGSLSRTTLIFMYSFHSPTSPFFFTSNLSGRQMVDENTELNPYLPRDSSHWFCVHGREFSTQKKPLIISATCYCQSAWTAENVLAFDHSPAIPSETDPILYFAFDTRYHGTSCLVLNALERLAPVRYAPLPTPLSGKIQRTCKKLENLHSQP